MLTIVKNEEERNEDNEHTRQQTINCGGGVDCCRCNPLTYDPLEIGDLRPSTYVSTTISAILKWIENMEVLYNWAQSIVGELDDINSDLVHQIELVELSDEQLLEVAKQQQTNRTDRRQAKHTAWALEALVNTMNRGEMKKAVSLLQEALGQTRKAEEKQAQQVYTPKRKLPDGEKTDPIPNKHISFGLTNHSGCLR